MLPRVFSGALGGYSWFQWRSKSFPGAFRGFYRRSRRFQWRSRRFQRRSRGFLGFLGASRAFQGVLGVFRVLKNLQDVSGTFQVVSYGFQGRDFSGV